MDRSGRHDRRVAVYWLASLEKISNYFFGLINVTLFALFSFRFSCMPACYYRCFSFREYLRLVCVVATNQSERGGVKIRWLPLPKALSWLAVCVVRLV